MIVSACSLVKSIPVVRSISCDKAHSSQHIRVGSGCPQSKSCVCVCLPLALWRNVVFFSVKPHRGRAAAHDVAVVLADLWQGTVRGLRIPQGETQRDLLWKLDMPRRIARPRLGLTPHDEVKVLVMHTSHVELRGAKSSQNIEPSWSSSSESEAHHSWNPVLGLCCHYDVGSIIVHILAEGELGRVALSALRWISCAMFVSRVRARLYTIWSPLQKTVARAHFSQLSLHANMWKP